MAGFALGWDALASNRARIRMLASGRYCTVAAPTKPPRPAVSLSHLRLNYYVQGQAGCCWIHSPKQLFEVTARATGFQPFSVCRRAIGYAAKQLYEGGGNPSDGGSPTDAINVMTSKGIGVAHEDLLPYSDDYLTLGQKPPQSVYDDAAKSHLMLPIRVTSTDQIVTLINAKHPVCNGYSCPDTMQDSKTFVDSFGGILGGHSQLIWGYALPGVFDEYLWLEQDGWWSLLYPPLPPSLAKLVDGYDPVTKTRTSSNWIRADVYSRLCNMEGGAEHISATGVDGLASGIVTPAVDPLVDVFPV